ncbi:MAG: GTP cyclohydrolase MptA [Candidatus Nezhaarchaeota archaeon]|nr:GTP cyclohydrolase MptA [Candidatus Nezhaarchaeota archaeon]
MSLPDIHRSKPAVSMALRKVGVKGIKMPVSFMKLGSKNVLIVPSFDVYIDLPPRRKGVDASRSYEVVAEVFSTFIKRTRKLEDLCSQMSVGLLKRHEYATRAEVRAKAEAVVERLTPVSAMVTFEPYRVYAKAVSRLRDGEVETRRMVGVKVIGVTACPCVAEGVRELSKAELSEALDRHSVDLSIIDALPIATHMQRSEGTLIMDSPEGHDVDVLKLIDIVEASMSSPTYELLKRRDEVDIVLRAARSPRFVEDSIRLMAKGVVETFEHLPDDVRVYLAQRSQESIHKHDMVAMVKTTLGELRLSLVDEGAP